MTASILVVDDDRWARLAVTQALEAEPSFAVKDAVGTGEEAVAAYEQGRPPDVTLMDINLGDGMNGVDATAEIVNRHPDAKIVLLTTVAPGPGIARALDAGALASVSKSASDGVLVEAVKKALQGDIESLHSTLAEDIVVSGDALPSTELPPPHLTNAEIAVLQLICQGLPYEKIAESLHIEVTTLKTHASHLRAKLHARSSAELIVRALQFKFYNPS